MEYGGSFLFRQKLNILVLFINLRKKSSYFY
ncbi:hypothetical protein IE3_03248 [Bacillus cereus BAG3X2-1]|nr:hypothetical protein IE3_03248 [Bacillus cereus BAG3X2-1]